jgi:hypothetical protein
VGQVGYLQGLFLELHYTEWISLDKIAATTLSGSDQFQSLDFRCLYALLALLYLENPYNYLL